MRRQAYESQQYAKGSVSTRRCSTLRPELQLTIVFLIKWFVLQNVSGKNYPSQDPRVPKMNAVWRYSSYFHKRPRKPANGYISEAENFFFFFFFAWQITWRNTMLIFSFIILFCVPMRIGLHTFKCTSVIPLYLKWFVTFSLRPLLLNIQSAPIGQLAHTWANSVGSGVCELPCCC